MNRHVHIFDTSLYCCWLRVPGRETAGSGKDTWTGLAVDALVAEAIAAGASLILPLATIIGTGNHIAQAPKDRFQHATNFCKHLKDAVNGESPWIAFTDQTVLWSPEQVLRLASEWPNLANSKISMGDATIKGIADHYALARFEVRIMTSDRTLRAYEPALPTAAPRRDR